MRNQRILLAAAATSLLILTACGSDDASSSDPSESVADAPADVPVTDAPAGGGASIGAASISMTATRFDPTEVQIAVGESVSFTNNDPFNHTVTSKDGSTIEYDSGNLGEGVTFVQAYGEPGTFDFFCKIHPTMLGTITVG